MSDDFIPQVNNYSDYQSEYITKEDEVGEVLKCRIHDP